MSQASESDPLHFLPYSDHHQTSWVCEYSTSTPTPRQRWVRCPTTSVICNYEKLETMAMMTGQDWGIDSEEHGGNGHGWDLRSPCHDTLL